MFRATHLPVFRRHITKLENAGGCETLTLASLSVTEGVGKVRPFRRVCAAF